MLSCGGTPLPEASGWDYAVPTMFEGVPAALRPPVALALAKAVESIPREDALPGGCCYEMKFDGFRAVCLVGADGVWLYSRQSKDLGRYFPDVLAAAAGQVPPGCVVDGELVVWSGDRLDFDALQLRMVTARAALPALVRERPASFVGFDVLAVAGQDTRNLPFADRRTLLEELARAWVPPLNLSPVTRDRAVAETWFKEMPATGVEGLVINSLLNERVDAVQEGGVWCEDGGNFRTPDELHLDHGRRRSLLLRLSHH
jgi:ATP-dependent DNA ligase